MDQTAERSTLTPLCARRLTDSFTLINIFVTLLFGLLIGISILKIDDASESSKSFTGKNWADNSYVQSHNSKLQSEYKVSWLFRIVSGSAEEISKVLGILVDRTFSQTNSQLEAPNYFYKAILGAASDSIDDPFLKESIRFFTDECISKVLPRFNPETNSSSFDRLFSRESSGDRLLASVVLSSDTGPSTTCFEVKNSLGNSLSEYARAHSTVLQRLVADGSTMGYFSGAEVENFVTSALLVSHYVGEHEGSLGLEKGTELPGTGGHIFQYAKDRYVVCT